MKRNRNIYTALGSLGIIIMFIISMIWPSMQQIAKVLALVIFGATCFASLAKQKKEGSDIQKNILFTIVLLAVLAYLFFF